MQLGALICRPAACPPPGPPTLCWGAQSLAPSSPRFAARADCGCTYRIQVQLVSADYIALASFEPPPVTIEQWNDASWREVRPHLLVASHFSQGPQCPQLYRLQLLPSGLDSSLLQDLAPPFSSPLKWSPHLIPSPVLVVTASPLSPGLPHLLGLPSRRPPHPLPARRQGHPVLGRLVWAPRHQQQHHHQP